LDEIEAREFKSPTKFREIADLYQKLKVATDATHDYRDSGAFFFNRLDMDRAFYKSQFRWPSQIGRIAAGLRYALYSLYRVFAGYGEKPLWSLIWLIILGIGFAQLQMFAGFTIPVVNGHRRVVQYLPCFDLSNNCFINDFIYSLIFSFSHLNLLQSAMHFGAEGLLPYDFGIWSLILNGVNSITLLILLTFFAIGLQKQFKRF
jgi:hypothetical protein